MDSTKIKIFFAKESVKAKDFLQRLFPEYIPHWLEELWIWIKRKFDHIIHSSAWQLAGMLLGIAFLCFATTYFSNMFTIPMGGDYVLQEIPFIYNGWDDWMHYFKTGEFVLWDTSGFLGVNNIGANSFYYLSSPWFLIYLLFPRSALSQVQGILTMFKLMTAGLLFFQYLRCFKMRDSTRKIGAIAYAFCGWMFYNLWFHFIDAATFLPLLLLGVEKVFQKKGPFYLILGIVLLGFTNYFFLASFCLASMPYVIFRAIQTMPKRKLIDTGRVFLNGIVGYLLGIGIVAVVLLPSITSVLNMPRVTGASYLDQLKNTKDILSKISLLMFFSPKYEVLYPLSSFFFMNITCFSTNLFRNISYNNTMSSIFVFTPMTLMLIPALFNSIRTKKFSHIIGVFGVLVMLLTPFCYYLFHAFTMAYGRWELMAVCWILVYLLITFDQRKQMPKFYMDVSILFTLVMMGVVGFLANLAQRENPTIFYTSSGGRNILIPVQMAYAFVCYIVMRIMFHKDRLSEVVLVMVALEAVVMGNVTIKVHGVQTYQHLAGGIKNVNTETKIIKALENYDNSFYRVYSQTADRGANNIQMQIGYNGISTFHSVYAFEVNDLLKWSRINYNDSWSMSVNEKRNNLEALLGVKYYLLKANDYNIPYGYQSITTLDATNDPSLKKLISAINKSANHKLYVNNNYIDTFFVYDDVISSSAMWGGDYYASHEVDNEVSYLKHAIVDKKVLADLKEKDIEAYSRLNVNGSIDSTNTIAYYDRQQIDNRPYNENHIEVRVPKWNEEGRIEGWDGEPEYGKLDSDIVDDYGTYIYKRDENNNYLKLPYWSRLFFDYSSKPLCAGADPSDPKSGCFISINSKFGYNIRYYLLDQNGNEITHDNHYWNGYDKSWDWKYARGFYTNKPVYTIVGHLMEDVYPGGMIGGLYSLGNNNYSRISSNMPWVQVTKNSDYQADINRLKEERKHINVIKHGVNSIEFETDFDEDKLHFTVINHPIDSGWSLKRTYKLDGKTITEKVPLYKTQGGLIGFEAMTSTEETGKIHYVLEYFPDGLGLGRKLTVISLIGTYIVGMLYLGLRLLKNPFTNKQYRKYFTLITYPEDKRVWERKHKIKRRYRLKKKRIVR